MKVISCETQYICKGILFGESYFWLEQIVKGTVYQMKLSRYLQHNIEH